MPMLTWDEVKDEVDKAFQSTPDDLVKIMADAMPQDAPDDLVNMVYDYHLRGQRDSGVATALTREFMTGFHVAWYLAKKVYDA